MDRIATTALAIVLFGCASASHAQAYPQRPVRIVVNVTAGGGSTVPTFVVEPR